MEPEVALDLCRGALIVALKIAFPMLCVGLVVGVTVSILQAVTQIQEMTLTFVPKIFAMTLAAAFFMPWIQTQLMEFAIEMFRPMIVP